MIRYQADSCGTVFYWWGGINRDILRPALVYFVFLVLLYIGKRRIGVPLVEEDGVFHDGVKGIMGFLVFLLVFRLNQCMGRYVDGVTDVNELFSILEGIVTNCVVNMAGANPLGVPHVGKPKEEAHRDESPEIREARKKEERLHFHEQALAAKVNCIRLVVALAITIAIHHQLCDAVCEKMGELDEIEMKQVIFLYARLRSLLYEQEMVLVDRAVYVTCEGAVDKTFVEYMMGRSEQSEPVYRAEMSRHFCARQSQRKVLLGAPSPDPVGEVTIAPLPKVMMTMLMNALLKPIDQPWGYSNRIWGLFSRQSATIIFKWSKIQTLIVSPTPLPYLQHCRVLLVMFSLVFPVSVDQEKGFMDNVLVPLALLWAMLGFETLSAMLENPFGNDDSDIDLMGLIHNLEVHCEHQFEAKEFHDEALSEALQQPLRDFRMAAASLPIAPPVEKGPSRRFSTYFQWRPVPTLILSDLMETHGQVEVLHMLKMNISAGQDKGIRTAIRRRSKRTHQGGSYHPITDNDTDDLHASFLGYDIDPKQIWHYLAFNGSVAANSFPLERGPVHPPRSSDHPSGYEWEARAAELLNDHSAVSLIAAIREEDTARSVMCFNYRKLHTSQPDLGVSSMPFPAFVPADGALGLQDIASSKQDALVCTANSPCSPCLPSDASHSVDAAWKRSDSASSKADHMSNRPDGSSIKPEAAGNGYDASVGEAASGLALPVSSSLGLYPQDVEPSSDVQLPVSSSLGLYPQDVRPFAGGGLGPPVPTSLGLHPLNLQLAASSAVVLPPSSSLGIYPQDGEAAASGGVAPPASTTLELHPQDAGSDVSEDSLPPGHYASSGSSC